MVSGLPLHTLTYTELRLIAEGKIHEAHRLHIRGHDTFMDHGDDPLQKLIQDRKVI